MRRKPYAVPLDPRAGILPGRRPSPADASNDAGKLTPFLVSGGIPRYILNDGPPNFDPRTDAVQLICSAYISDGNVGFLKSIRVAPFMPPVFGPDPVNNDLLRWRAPDARYGPDYGRPSATAGVWETPLGWEGYFDDLADPAVPPPRWEWQLRAFQGTLEALRDSHRNVPPFSFGDPVSWFMVPDIPVPASTYAAGLPGRALGAPFGPQRVQVLQGDGLLLHIPIPSDTTVCLFARWKQQALYPLTMQDAGATMVQETPWFPLLPSFGQMAGYSLPEDCQEARELVKTGW